MSDIPFAAVVTDRDQLVELYREPHPLVARKKIDQIDDGARDLIAAAPFVLISTSDADGRCTVSPKGGVPGFVRVLDRHRLGVPDYPGNNLLDSLHHLLANPHLGLLFLLPGHDEILRVEGRAWITTDERLLDELSAEDGRRPKTAIGVQVESTFVHCAASIRRGRLWDPASWDELTAPSTSEVVKGHLALTDPDRDAPAPRSTGGGADSHRRHDDHNDPGHRRGRTPDQAAQSRE